MHYDTIVIGSGLSGLTSALLLSRSGRKVLVLEQSNQIAPVVRGFFRGGCYFDSGFHYAGGLGEGGAFRPLLRHLGLEDKLQLTPYDARGFDRLQISDTGEAFSLPVGFDAIRSSLCKRFPGVQRELLDYLDELEGNWSRYPYLDLDTDIADFGISAVHGQSLRDRLKVFSDYPQLQGLLSMHSLLYGISPGEAPLSLNSQVAGSYYHSVHGIAGGGRALVDALPELLVAEGVDIRCRAEVSSIRIVADSVGGVSLADGEEIAAKEVIATVNPAQLPGLLPKGVLRPAYLKRLKNLRQTLSAYILFARCSGPLETLRDSNLFVQQKAGLFTADTDRPLEVREFYLTASGQGPDNGETGLIGIVPASYSEVAEWGNHERRHSQDYRAHKQFIADRLRRMFAASCPDLSDLQVLDLATPLTLRDYSCAPQGAIYGVGRFLGQYNPHPVTRLSGLSLSGQAIAAPGLLGTVVASYLTCGSIIGHEQLRGELRACR